MAGRKTPHPQQHESVPGVPRLYAEEADHGTGAFLSPLLPVPTSPPPPPAPERKRPTVEEPPETIRAFHDSGEFEATEEIPDVNVGGPTSVIPNLAKDDEIPNLSEDDGTHTDKTALLLDRSRRQGDRPTLTILTGVSAGLVVPLDKLPLTIGRAKGVEMQLSDAGVSRKHARVASPVAGLYVLEDLGSTNGVRVNGLRAKRCDLRAGDRVQLGPEVVLQFAFLDDAEENLTKHLYTAATRDALTLALNRGTFDERLLAELSYSRRHGAKLCLIMLDVDHFKRVNDTYGHVAGDLVLREVAHTVRRTIRNEDVFARYGGEEFALLVRGETRAQAAVFAERIRVAVSAAEAKWHAAALKVTISLGVAELSECAAAAGPKDFIALADQRLYRAKELGRNRVVSE